MVHLNDEVVINPRGMNRLLWEKIQRQDNSRYWRSRWQTLQKIDLEEDLTMKEFEETITRIKTGKTSWADRIEMVK